MSNASCNKETGFPPLLLFDGLYIVLNSYKALVFEENLTVFVNHIVSYSEEMKVYDSPGDPKLERSTLAEDGESHRRARIFYLE